MWGHPDQWQGRDSAAREAVLGAEVKRLRAALLRAHEQLSKFDYKGPKQVGRAMLTMERALGLDPSSSERS